MRVIASLPLDDWRSVAPAARAAERLGYDGVQTSELAHDLFAPLTLATLETERVELATGIAVAFPRSPMVVANIARDLQANSDGRFHLGLGTQVKGHNERRFSVPWSGSPVTRLREYVESLRAIWRVWEHGGKLAYEGEHYRFTLMTPEFSPGPTGLPMVPVSVAAVGRDMLRMAGRICDGARLHGFCTRRYIENVAMPRIDEGLARSRRERRHFEISGGGFVATGPDDGAVAEMVDWVRYRVAFYGSTRTYWPVFEQHDLVELGAKLHRMSVDGQWDRMAAEVSDDVVRLFAAVGRHDEIAGAIAEVFDRAGCARDEAKRIALRLVRANLTGHDSHGVIRTSRYVDWLERGMFRAGQRIRVDFETEAMAIVDGCYGFGQTVAEQAVQLGLEKARAHGVSVIALRNAGHIGRVGDWAEMAAEAGFASAHFVNARASILVAPFGGTDPRLSTAPFCAGVPRPDGPPVILDFATSVVAEGKVLVAAKGGKPLPDGSLIDGAGNLTTDPRALYGEAGPDAPPGQRDGTGAIRAMGEHKGSGLALFCELLGGALTGNGTTGPWQEAFANGMLSIYFSVEAFDRGGGFAEDVRRYLDYVRAANPARPGQPVLTPGDPERTTMAERMADGVPLSDDAWASIVGAARRVGLGDSEISTLSGWNGGPP